jgi:MerR family transcriptional regulator/heat shock protein HspR
MKRKLPHDQFIKEESRPLYTLVIASQLSGIPAHSIRQYIDKGLLIPYKLESKRHLFSAIDVNRLKHIHKLIHEQGLNFAGIRTMMSMIPCWAIRECSQTDRKDCDAYYSYSFPCWEASRKGRLCKNENCRECQVYNCCSTSEELKSVLRELIP